MENTPTLTTIQESSAPWNETSNLPRKFDVWVTQTLVKHDVIQTKCYVERYQGKDEDGLPDIEIDTSNVDWKAEWKSECYDIPFLLRELEAYVKEELKETSKADAPRRRGLERMLKACKGWVVEETEVEED